MSLPASAPHMCFCMYIFREMLVSYGGAPERPAKPSHIRPQMVAIWLFRTG